jgi:glycosyltransferase involved in cell wall biosynthesis
MRIALFITLLDQIGGAEIGTCRLANRLAQRGHTITLLTTQGFSQRRPIFEHKNGLRIVRLPVWQRSRRISRWMLLAHAFWAFPASLRNTQILHLRGLKPETIVLARAARRWGLKTICVPMASGADGDVALLSEPPNPLEFDWISALTESLRAEVIAWGFPAEKTGTIPNGVPLDFFHPIEPPCADPNAIYVGQFRPEKRIADLLYAWRRIEPAFPHARLTLVGGGQRLGQYQALARQLGIQPTFIPDTDAVGVRDQLGAHSIFVLPGISEGMSNALLEAMAMGLAPLVSDTPPNRAVIVPENNGLTYEAGNPVALAGQLKRLIGDAELRQRLGAAARQTVIQRFDLDQIAAQYLSLYEKLIA